MLSLSLVAILSCNCFKAGITRSYNVQNGMRGERISLEKCEGMLQLNPSANLVGA